MKIKKLAIRVLSISFVITLLSTGVINAHNNDVNYEMTDEQIKTYETMGMDKSTLNAVIEEHKNEKNSMYTDTEKTFLIEKMGYSDETFEEFQKEADTIDDIVHEKSVKDLKPKHSGKSSGKYPRDNERGYILVTRDGVGGVFKVGHSAIVTNHRDLTESNPGVGVHISRGENNWWKHNSSVAVTVNGSSKSARDRAASFSEGCRGKSYNYRLYNKWETSEYYCSSLIWRAYYNLGWDLDTEVMGRNAITPYEFVNNTQTTITYNNNW
ncbi:YiiX/YebB-like N1pC/P60 family cysteine hydrolase [Peptostreptococcus faecalis]|uniref:YiiX/YebB-like N1pC/P60 family cysteine hydrolase n=1 Tax=Peptostreptococcus faecalis TaxID=2045015 RepID=UPI000C7A04CC|nr:YiiX/YebB-like N1pC/P60 family cysteine hydrolase [Peptostreptococcus faecalis]